MFSFVFAPAKPGFDRTFPRVSKYQAKPLSHGWAEEFFTCTSHVPWIITTRAISEDFKISLEQEVLT